MLPNDSILLLFGLLLCVVVIALIYTQNSANLLYSQLNTVGASPPYGRVKKMLGGLDRRPNNTEPPSQPVDIFPDDRTF
jgi:hypothetical protein